MPLCTLHLLALHNSTPDPLSAFLSTLKSSTIKPLVVSRVIRWIILPTKISTSHLLSRNIKWDILLILPSTDNLPADIAQQVEHHWSVTAGVPSRLTNDFATTNKNLLHPSAASVPPLSDPSTQQPTTPSSQALELSTELSTWIAAFLARSGRESTGPVSMFNLLAFHPGLKPQYLEYGAAFASTVGARHGGCAKIVGNVVRVHGVEKDDDGWDEIALAHYPSIAHFRDMLASAEYQRVNRRYRLPSLRDTCILMTSEVGVEEGLGEGRTGARL
mgnify:CR=1 FL=1